jgi:N-acetyltransferase 10
VSTFPSLSSPSLYLLCPPPRARRYAIGGSKDEWATAEAAVAARLASGKAGRSSVVSVKNPESTKGQKRKAGGADEEGAGGKKKEKKDKKRKKQA